MTQKFIKHRIRLIALCLVFVAFFATNGRAQLFLPPIINVQPSDTDVLNGDTAVMSTTVALSLTPLKFQWFLNGQKIATNNNITVKNSALLGILGIEIGVISKLSIYNISSTNAGNYSVQIQNGGGSVISKNAILTVLTSAVSNVVNIVSAATGMTPDGFKIQLSGPSGSNYVVQASTDLKNWTSLATNSAPTGSISYTDTSATNRPFRFYRATIQ
ncbi:MAG: immunoglobulin domain-containing protein [Limisphaerales bacterium]